MKHRHKLLQLIQDNARGDRAEGERSIRVEVKDDQAHVYLYDVIDAWWGASAKDLITALTEAGDRDVQLHINSPGGDVFEARAMASAIVAYPGRVTAHVDGLAASAATTVAVAAEEVRITEGGLFMIHNSWTIAWGNKGELRDTADLLEKVDGSIAADYVRRTGKAVDQVTAWMDDETWFSSAEALEHGFVDAVDPATRKETSARALASRWNLSAYRNAPKLGQGQRPPAADPVALQASIEHARQLRANRVRLLDA
jgi:ATP-dependent Clp protease protease subunit